MTATEDGGAVLAGTDGGHGNGTGADHAMGAASNGSASAASTTRGRRQAGDGPSLLDQAVAEVRAGNAARGVELLMSAAGRGRSRRERFIRRTTAARVMVDAGLHAVAVPLLEQLVADVDAFKLEEWESGDVVAAPMALLWRCYDRTGRDAAKEPLYLRVCRLDPVQAIALGPAAGGAS